VKSLLPILSTLAIFNGCVNYDGSFRAEEKLKFKHTTIFGRTKTKTLGAGQYKTSFEVTSGKKLKFTFKGNDTLEVKMKLPRNIDLPNSDGSFFFMAEETGQNYDITGNLKTDYSSSGIISGVETCSYTIYERQCHRVCNDTVVADKDSHKYEQGRRGRGDHPRRPRRPLPPSCTMVCNNVPVTYYGNQNVRYRINYTKKGLHLSMNKPQNDKVVATYSGHHQSSYRTYEFKGRCR